MAPAALPGRPTPSRAPTVRIGRVLSLPGQELRQALAFAIKGDDWMNGFGGAALPMSHRTARTSTVGRANLRLSSLLMALVLSEASHE